MNFEEFLEPRDQKNDPNQMNMVSSEADEADSEETNPEELDVQKAVVEELAADKAALDVAVSAQEQQIGNLQQELAKVKSELEQTRVEVSRLQGEIQRQRADLAAAKDAVASEQALTARVKDEFAAEKEKQFDRQERNPNALALIDREVELPDRFPGETRDHVLEELRAARDRAEAEGRLRTAQVLEGVLCANEPNGTLAEKREELKRLFAENGNVINGTVIEELKKMGLTHKNGEEYLLVDEIIKRAY